MASTKDVVVGYEIGTGIEVSIPVRHMAVTGQTQESGKTTTLEALVERSGATALAFVTKRGERSFDGARRIQPYFRDRADWQFVTSILDATLQEKNKFLRPWIIKTCRTTTSLADVQREVRKALKTATDKKQGMNEGVYTQLDAYLDLIVPEIQRARLATRLELTPGLNVMDVSGVSTPMQMLFIQSALDWINEKEDHVVVVVPEAWEFIPEGKGSPVKSSAETLIRKGGGIGNHIWVDSQDMAGVDKMVLRGCAVWLIGVQREANEIKRNLSNIPKSIKQPTAAMVAELTIGQFYVCWGKHAVKTYVQPAWMNPAQAQQVATGQLSVDHATKLSPKTHLTEDTVNETEARALREENADLRRQVEDLRHQLPAVIAERQAKAKVTAPVAREFSAEESLDNEAMYQAFKTRLAAEAPGILKVLTIRPELIVEVERQQITAKGDSLRGRVAQLIVDGFYDRGATAPGTQKELGRRGSDPGPANTYKELDALAVMGFLTIEQGRDERSRPRKEYHVVKGMKVNIVNG